MSGDTIHIGKMAATLDTSGLDELVRRAQQLAERDAKRMAVDDRSAFLHRRSPLTFAEFRQVAENHHRARNDINANGFYKDLNAHRGGTLTRTLSPQFEPTPQGWLAYLGQFHPTVAAALPATTAEQPGFPEYVRERHTLVVAGAGSGKSTLLKTIVHHYVANTRSAVMVLDPHGELVEHIAKWPDFAHSDRLVVIDAGLFPGMTVGVNPLDGRGMNLQDRNKAALGFGKLFNEFTGGLSQNMSLLSAHCAEVLYGVEGATIRDFMRMLRVPEKPRRRKEGEEPPPVDARTAELMHAAQNHPREGIRDFFREEFDGEYYGTTRNSLRARLQQLTANMAVEAMLTGGPQTIDLAKALNSGKVVLVNLKSFGDEAVRPVGLLFLAMVSAFAVNRGTDNPRKVPVHLFIDELTRLGGPEVVAVVNELRKFGVHATFAQQTGGQGFESAEMKEALFNSTAIKILASDRPQQFAKLAGLDFNALPSLKEREFWVKWGDTSAVHVVATDPKFAGDRYRMTPGEWADTLADLEDRDYRPAFVAPPAAPSRPPSGNAGAPPAASPPRPSSPPGGAGGPPKAAAPEPPPQATAPASEPPRPSATPKPHHRPMPPDPFDLDLD